MPHRRRTTLRRRCFALPPVQPKDDGSYACCMSARSNGPFSCVASSPAPIGGRLLGVGRCGPAASPPASKADTSSPRASKTDALAILPTSVVLRGPKAQQALVVERRKGDSLSARRRRVSCSSRAIPKSCGSAIRWRFRSPTASGRSGTVAGAHGQRGSDRGTTREQRALELPQPRAIGADKSGLQLRRLSRRGGGKERFQVVAASLRSRGRLPDDHPPVAGPPDRAVRPRAEPVPDEADRRGSA